MQLGAVVDFCIEYNDRQEKAAKAVEEADKKKAQPQKRKATQGDINAFFG